MADEKKNSVKTMSEEEKKELDELYQYVKDLLGYDENQTLSSQIVLRLKGLRYGKTIERRDIEDKAKYSYKVILYTFMACKQKILQSIKTKEFTSDFAKMLYICAIVENNINDIYMRTQRAEQAQKSIEKADVSALGHKGAVYKSSQPKKTNKRLEDLW